MRVRYTREATEKSLIFRRRCFKLYGPARVAYLLQLGGYSSWVFSPSPPLFRSIFIVIFIDSRGVINNDARAVTKKKKKRFFTLKKTARL